MDTIMMKIEAPLLKEKLIEFIGDVVENAFLIDYCYLEESRDYTEKCLRDNLRNKFSFFSDDEIDFDSADILIEFTTGKCIVLSSSEWGWIRKAYLYDYSLIK